MKKPLSRRIPFLVAAFTLVGCGGTTQPGLVNTAGVGSFATVGAGNFEPNGHHDGDTRYLVDRATRTCWLQVGTALAALDCCALRRVPAAAPLLPWVTGATCATPADAAHAPAAP